MSTGLHHYIQQQASPLEAIPTGQEPATPPLPGIRAVVFDVYGTLIISGVGDISLASADNKDQAIRKSLEAYGLNLGHLQEDLWTRFQGVVKVHQDNRRKEGIPYPEVEIRKVWKDLIQQLLVEGAIETDPIADIDAFSLSYEMQVNPVWPMPNLTSTLETLQIHGLPMGIISNAQFFSPLILETFLRRDLETAGFSLNCNVWSYLELEGKPSQGLYQKARERWISTRNIEPSEILYVGNDMRNDIWPAQALGFRTALFAGDQRSLRLRDDDADCQGVQPDWVITDLAQIVDALLAG